MSRPPFVPHAEHRVKRTRPVGARSPAIAPRTPDDRCGDERTGGDDYYCLTDTESVSDTTTTTEGDRSRLGKRRPAGRSVQGGTERGRLVARSERPLSRALVRDMSLRTREREGAFELLNESVTPRWHLFRQCKPCTPRKGYLRSSVCIAYDDAPRHAPAHVRREQRRCDSVAHYCRGRLAPHTTPSDSVFEPFYNDRATRTMTRDRSHPQTQTGGTA